MSRIGKIPVEIPGDVKVRVDAGVVHLEGPKGRLSFPIPTGIRVETEDGRIVVRRVSDAKQHRANHGTVRAHLQNMIVGVRTGHRKDLEIQGIGFRAQMQGRKLVLALGFSHPVEFEAPDGVSVSAPNQTSIVVEGCDKAFVGEVAARIRRLKPPEPYKGKGIRYVGERVRRKQGKSVGK